MENNKSAGGIKSNGALQIAFIVLKLCKVINWSWWWVLAPTWIGLVIVVICFIILCVLSERRTDE